MIRLASFLALFVVPAFAAPELYFSPNGGGEARIVQLIDGARSSIHGMIYSVNSPPITEALLRARRRGVNVRLLCDYTQAAGRTATVGRLSSGGIPLYAVRGSGGGVMHLKALVVDGRRSAFGSMNWTKPGEAKNDEVLAVDDDVSTAAKLTGRFEYLWSRARARAK